MTETGIQARAKREMARAVLVVDDDPFIRRLIVTTLEDVADFEIHEAADGMETLEVARRERPALVLLDIDMPRIDGIGACRQLRAESATSATTIAMLTAADGNAIQREAVAAGADLYPPSPSVRSICFASSIVSAASGADAVVT